MILPVVEIVLMLAVFVAYPLYSWRTYPAERAAVAAGHKSRLAVYGEVMLFEWLAVALLVPLWLAFGRTWTHLGLGSDLGLAGDGPGWGALGLWAAMVAFLGAQTVMVLASADTRRQIRSQIGDLDTLLPNTPKDLAGFAAVSVTAGICEEILFRGYLYQWLQGLGLGVLGAAAISTVAFGLAHGYQGRTGALKAGITGAILMVLTVLTGALWAAIVLHVVVDLAGGFAAYWATRKDGGLKPSEAV